MALKTRYQKDLFLDITPWENRLPEAERQRLKALLGELIFSVFEAEEQASERREVGHLRRHLYGSPARCLYEPVDDAILVKGRGGRRPTPPTLIAVPSSAQETV